MLKLHRQEKASQQKIFPEKLDNCRELERIERTWRLIRKIPALEQKVIVDVGSGMGEIAKRLKKMGAIVHALDVPDTLPKTKLHDAYYDIVICTDVIAYLPPNEHRLLMLELSRIVKKEGYVICSTSLDIYSEEPLNLFLSLLQTEFIVEDLLLSYHALHIKMKNLLKRTFLSNLFRQNRKLLLLCENLTKTFNQEAGVSHAISLGRRKPLL